MKGVSLMLTVFSILTTVCFAVTYWAMYFFGELFCMWTILNTHKWLTGKNPNSWIWKNVLMANSALIIFKNSLNVSDKQDTKL